MIFPFYGNFLVLPSKTASDATEYTNIDDSRKLSKLKFQTPTHVNMKNTNETYQYTKTNNSAWKAVRKIIPAVTRKNITW